MAKKSKKEANVPNLRFPGFRNDWKSAKLGDIVDFKVTNSLSRERLNYKSGTVKNIHYGDIHTKFQTLFDIDKENVPFINGDVPLGKVQEDYYCKDGDWVFADASEDVNDIGKSIEILNVGSQKVLAGLHTLHGRPKPGVFFPGFPGYLLRSNSVRNQIQREAQGAKVLGISVTRISKINLIYPSIEEQEKIAVLLSRIDDRIQTQNKIIRRLESLIKVLADSLIRQAVALDSSVVILSDLGCSFSGLSGKTKEHFGSGKKYIQYKQVFDSSKININNFDLVQVEENEKQCKAKFGDVFFTISSETPNEIGMSSVLLEDVDEVYLNSFCFGFRPNSFELTNPHFLRFYFRSTIFRNELQKLAQGSTRYNMSKTAFLKLKIVLPGIKSQKSIAALLTAIDNKIEIEKSILQKWVNQKTYCLLNTFT